MKQREIRMGGFIKSIANILMEIIFPQKLLKEHGESMNPERFLKILSRTIVTGLLKNQEEYFQNLCV